MLGKGRTLVYSKQHSDHYLVKVPDNTRRCMLPLLYAVLDATADAQRQARRKTLNPTSSFCDAKSIGRHILHI